jgi:hypothetical protein
MNGWNRRVINPGDAILLRQRTRRRLRSKRRICRSHKARIQKGIALVRYFLHQTYETMRIPDPDGECFPDLKDAEKEAIVSARQIVGDTLLRGGCPNFGKIQICNESGTVLKEVSFRAAIFGEADLS